MTKLAPGRLCDEYSMSHNNEGDGNTIDQILIGSILSKMHFWVVGLANQKIWVRTEQLLNFIETI